MTAPEDWREKWLRTGRHGFTTEEIRACHADLRDDDPALIRREVKQGLVIREKQVEHTRRKYARSR